VAERILRKHLNEAALAKSSLVDARAESIRAEAQKPIALHLSTYAATLRAAGRTLKHIRETRTRIGEIVAFSRWSTVADIVADDVVAYIASRKDLSAKTVGSYLTSIKSFTHWLMTNHKLASDPLVSLRRPNPKADRKRVRRFLLSEEWRWLQCSTNKSATRHGMDGSERSLLYATAIQTGLRANELRSLKVGDLFLKSAPPYVVVQAGSTKNRKAARQYVKTNLARLLANHVRTKTPSAKVFNMSPWLRSADMLRDDLNKARVLWLESAKGDPDEYERRVKSDFLLPVDHAGQVMDFHALRHTTGAWLSVAGVHPGVIQKVMRHSTITLTMDTYGHLFPGAEADAVNKMPEVPYIETLRATGTDGETSQSARTQSHPLGHETMRNAATECHERVTPQKSAGVQKPLQNKGKSDSVRRGATASDDSGDWTRTSDLRAMNPLL